MSKSRLPPKIQKMAVAAAEAEFEALLAAQNPTFTSEDVKRLKDLARLEYLKLDHDLKLMALDVSVERFTRPAQGLAAAALATAHREIVRLQDKLGLPRMPRHPLVTRAETMRVSFNRRAKPDL